jgi:hypothetical protein
MAKTDQQLLMLLRKELRACFTCRNTTIDYAALHLSHILKCIELTRQARPYIATEKTLALQLDTHNVGHHKTDIRSRINNLATWFQPVFQRQLANED